MANATATIDRLVAAIASGAGAFDQVRNALNKVQNDQDCALAELQDQDALPVVAIHPAIVADYRRQVADLQTAPADPEAGPQAATALRALTNRIVLTPDPHGCGVSVQVKGRLAGSVR